MNAKLKSFAVKWILMLGRCGVNPKTLVESVCGVPRYIRDFRRFRAGYSGSMRFQPCLIDWYKPNGDTQTEYFWQDLLVAQMIFRASPQKHVDVGSRVEGFISSVASFREIEVLDIRSMSSNIPNVTFKQADMMDENGIQGEICDSLSCLHALEHFGLGRYGDPIDQGGAERGFRNMARLLKPEGTFYLSVPIGRPCVEFNANRIFDPHAIMDWADRSHFKISKLIIISPYGSPQELPCDASTLSKLSTDRYNLGLFVFRKAAM